ncbi:site-2 protease family protein [Micromonospora sp. NPDC000207]|uniref:site-2 protease family protein n=1 Tax=Micromonospora sp. NPDC000207 TaxID=3154246 RepID=UPI00331660AF
MAHDRPGVEPEVFGVPRAALRPSPVFLALVALFVTCGVLAWNEVGNVRLNVFGFVVAGWLVSLCLHEYAHAVVAFRAGDRSVAHRGYLTLNPLKYTHPLLSVVLPVAVVLLGGIGLPGGAVWVDRHSIPGRLRHTLVSLAGPATNVLFTLILVAALRIGTGAGIGGSEEFWAGLALLAFLQLTASVLNLLPVPGLDGGNMIQPWLNPQWRRMYDLFAPFGFIMLFALLWNPRLGGWFFDGVFALANLIGLPPWLYVAGLDLIRFWQS